MTNNTEQIAELRRLAAEAKSKADGAQDALIDQIGRVAKTSSELSMDGSNLELHQRFADEIAEGNTQVGIREGNRYLTDIYGDMADDLENKGE